MFGPFNGRLQNIKIISFARIPQLLEQLKQFKVNVQRVDSIRVFNLFVRVFSFVEEIQQLRFVIADVGSVSLLSFHSAISSSHRF